MFNPDSTLLKSQLTSIWIETTNQIIVAIDLNTSKLIMAQVAKK